jgi:hypothetical protein
MQAITKSTGADKSLGWGVKSADPCDGTCSGMRCDKDEGRVTSEDASMESSVTSISLRRGRAARVACDGEGERPE